MRDRLVCAALAAFTVLTLAACSGDEDLDLLVATLAGAGPSGLVNATGAAARFNNPVNVAVGPDGNVYVTDFDNDALRRVTPGGSVTTVMEFPNNTRPFGIVFDDAGTLYVQTDGNPSGNRDNTTGTVWRVNIAGGTANSVATNIGRPRGLAAMPDGRLLLSDLAHHVLRVLNPNTGQVTRVAGQEDVAGFADGTGSNARFRRPYGADRLPDGDFLVADQDNNRIRLVHFTGLTSVQVSTWAGNGTAGLANGQRQTATFNGPQDVAIDALGTVYVADNRNVVIRRVTSNGQVSLFAGTPGIEGFADGPLLDAEFFGMEGLDLAAGGGTLYIADGSRGDDDEPFHRVRVIDLR